MVNLAADSMAAGGTTVIQHIKIHMLEVYVHIQTWWLPSGGLLTVVRSVGAGRGALFGSKARKEAGVWIPRRLHQLSQIAQSLNTLL